MACSSNKEQAEIVAMRYRPAVAFVARLRTLDVDDSKLDALTASLFLHMSTCLPSGRMPMMTETCRVACRAVLMSAVQTALTLMGGLRLIEEVEAVDASDSSPQCE